MVLAEHTHPDIVLLDINLPHINGIATSREICSRDRNVGIIFVSVHVDEEYVSEAFKAGARGYVLADSAQSDLIPAIRVVARGDRFLSPSITSQLLDGYTRTQISEHEPISEHQKQLFCLLAEGFDDDEIARHMHTTVDNVRSDFQTVNNMLLHVGIPELIRQSIGNQVT
jgi:DNA-binding NarL/FixJ family response regulator